MINENLVGRCGLYCGACIIYRAYKDSEELRRIIAKDNNCKPEEIRCEGCQTVLTEGWKVEEKWGKNCKIVRTLAKEHGASVIVVTHDNRIENIANRILYLEDGMIKNEKIVNKG